MALSMLPPAVLPAASSAVSASVSTTDYQPMHLLRHQQDHFMQILTNNSRLIYHHNNPHYPRLLQYIVAFHRRLMPAPSIERTLSSQSWRTSRSGPVHLSYIHNPDILIASTADMAMPSPLVMGTGHISPANMQQFLDFHMAQTGSPNALRPSNFRPPSRASSTSLAAASKNSI
ncbi:hypothetical protein BASA61_005740 [Batrachochytrium salamandrivorans]|nr:hypothetical protein BASA61_005740 [Batrachochytrium salamandrivorans]